MVHTHDRRTRVYPGRARGCWRTGVTDLPCRSRMEVNHEGRPVRVHCMVTAHRQGRPTMTASGSDPAAGRDHDPAAGRDHDPADVGFTTFYRREYRSVYALCLALAGPAAADDLTQDAFIRAHRQWERIVAYDVPAAWVRRVAINLSTSLARRLAAEARALR